VRYLPYDAVRALAAIRRQTPGRCLHARDRRQRRLEVGRHGDSLHAEGDGEAGAVPRYVEDRQDPPG